MRSDEVENEAATCIVIGANGEIGRAVAEKLAQNGHPLVLTASGAHRVPDWSPASRKKCLWRVMDVTNSEQVATVMHDIASASTNRFHVAYCAGIVHDQPIAQLSMESWHRVFAVNLDGAFSVLHSAFRHLAVRGSGRIVFIGSIADSHGFPGQAAYCASKAGLAALARVAAVELGRFGVTCNVIAPGAIESAMVRNVHSDVVARVLGRTPLRKMGTAMHVAETVLFLLSEGATHITGQTIVLDGGLSVA